MPDFNDMTSNIETFEDPYDSYALAHPFREDASRAVNRPKDSNASGVQPRTPRRLNEASSPKISDTMSIYLQEKEDEIDRVGKLLEGMGRRRKRPL
jgi:hypothetical protein